MKMLLLKLLALAALSIGAMLIPLATALFAVGKDEGGKPFVNIQQLMPKPRCDTRNPDISQCGFRRDDDRVQRWAWGYKQYRYGEYPELEISTLPRTRDNSRIILPKGF